MNPSNFLAWVLLLWPAHRPPRSFRRVIHQNRRCCAAAAAVQDAPSSAAGGGPKPSSVESRPPASSSSESFYPELLSPPALTSQQGSDCENKPLSSSIAAVLNYASPLATPEDLQMRRDPLGRDDFLPRPESRLLSASSPSPPFSLWSPVTVRVLDGRERSLTLDRHGFELVDFDVEYDPGDTEGGGWGTSPTPPLPPIDYYDPESVVARYYPACERLVRDRLEKRPKGGRGRGAASKGVFVRAFDHNVRHAAGRLSSSPTIRRRDEGEGDDERIGNCKVLGPAGIVHNDYTAASAVRRLEQLSTAFGSGIGGDGYYRSRQNDVKLPALEAMGRDGRSLPIIPGRLASGAIQGKRRFAIVNVWRSLDASHPVVSFPLALLDAASVSPTDLKVLRIHYVDRVGENYVATANRDHHRWYYFPAIKGSEALLIKQWDSQGSLCRPGLPSDRSAAATLPPLPSSSAGAPGPSSLPFCSTFALLTALAVPSGPSSPPPPSRRSIEVRCVCVWEEEENGSVEEKDETNKDGD